MTAAFEEFLKDYKTSPEQTITTALGNITIDEDDLSDEYDFMDDDEEGAADRRRQEKELRRTPQLKYRQIIQKLADRTVDEITIDFDDLTTVRGNPHTSSARRLRHCSGNTKQVAI